MQINPVTHAVPTAPPEKQAAPASAAAKASTSPVITPSQVSAAVVQRANGDGDGRTGTAALNDGDAAARAAAASRGVNFRA
jgi:hypothetical protein